MNLEPKLSPSKRKRLLPLLPFDPDKEYPLIDIEIPDIVVSVIF